MNEIPNKKSAALRNHRHLLRAAWQDIVHDGRGSRMGAGAEVMARTEARRARVDLLGMGTATRNSITGTISVNTTTRTIMDLSEAIVVLDMLAKHWTFQCENTNGLRRGYSVKVWVKGRRFTVQRRWKIDALNTAINRIRDLGARPDKINAYQKAVPNLKLVGT